MNWEVLNNPENTILKKKKITEIVSIAKKPDRLPFSQYLKALPRKQRKKILEDRNITKEKMIKSLEKPYSFKGFIKNTFKIRNIVIIGFITFTIFYPKIERYFIEKKINRLDVEERPPIEFVNQDKIVVNEEGSIVEKPITDEELYEAHIFTKDKLFDDLDFLESQINNIEKIVGIYKHNLFNENYDKNDSLIDVVFKSDDKLYSLTYTVDGEEFEEGSINFEKGLNDAETLLNFMSTLQNFYISNLSNNDESKKDVISTLNSLNSQNYLVGDVLYYNEGTLEGEYHIPVYTENSCTVYSITERNLANHSMDMSNEDMFNLLVEYLNNENELFTTQEITTMKNSDEIEKAFDNGEENRKKIELNIMLNSIEDSENQQYNVDDLSNEK